VLILDRIIAELQMIQSNVSLNMVLYGTKVNVCDHMMNYLPLSIIYKKTDFKLKERGQAALFRDTTLPDINNTDPYDLLQNG